MVERIKKRFDEGIERIKWLAAMLAGRMRVEMAVVKLLIRAGDLQRERSRIVNTLGERVYELRDKGEVSVFKDARVQGAVLELEKIEEELRGLRTRVAEVGAGEDEE